MESIELPTSAHPQQSPRAALVAHLTQAIADATAAGDLAAAKVAHEALGKLLAEPGPGADAVVDLATEKAKRRRD